MPLPPSSAATAPLAMRHCQPREGETALDPEHPSTRRLLREVPHWNVTEQGKLRREWVLEDFLSVMLLVRKIADVAEAEGHHPDIHMTDYKHLAVELNTHDVGGLSENDFILAAKIDRLASGPSG